MENSNVDYERFKNQYPLRENANADPKNRINDFSNRQNNSNINQNDISAVLQDDSMI